jgi:hypothetical protein
VVIFPLTFLVLPSKTPPVLPIFSQCFIFTTSIETRLNIFSKIAEASNLSGSFSTSGKHSDMRTYSRIELLNQVGTYGRIELLNQVGTYGRIGL